MDEAQNQVTLEQMLSIREQRAEHQQQLLQKHGKTLVCFCMNIAGPVKTSWLIEMGFTEGCRLLEGGLKVLSMNIIYRFIKATDAGKEAYYVIDADCNQVKRLCCEIEENNTIGRIFDLDVLDVDGRKISREESGFAPRKCFLCGCPAKNCARSRQHSVEELFAYTENVLEIYFRKKREKEIASIAIKSLLFEVIVTPKPGLVDRLNSGSHSDMDVFTFMSSASVLFDYFERCVHCGFECPEGKFEQILDKLRYFGIQAENDMLCATDGVNTHKGAIFSLGLVCAANGYLSKNYSKVSPVEALSLTTKLKESLMRPLQKLEKQAAVTNGEKLYVKEKVNGIRGEVAQGFPTVRKIALPVLLKGLDLGFCLNDSAAAALLHIMSVCDDTNILARSSLQRHMKIKSQLKKILNENPFPNTEIIRELDNEFISEHISAGGSADLLAVTLFTYFMS